MRVLNSILRSCLQSVCCAGFAGLSACANMDQIQACNRMSYEQAPVVYKDVPSPFFNRCVHGLVSTGSQARMLGLSANPFFCDLSPDVQDLNYDARVAIFEACRKGQIATSVPPIVQPH